MLQELPIHQRADAVSSLVYEANARVRDPVYGCVGAISYLQNQVSELQMQLAVAQAEILCIQMQNEQVIPTQEINQDQKSYFIQDELTQYLNYGSSSSNNVIHDSLKRDNMYGHDMVS
ncbi:LOB domain-containing protein 12, variant 2 [Trifolium repens]|nr:LOB domain-containing protein 12, variant 2 [Trifolium repens]WJX64202.1 LOB domain-containing protein 12, variant 2 [Trifolium repens]